MTFTDLLFITGIFPILVIFIFLSRKNRRWLKAVLFCFNTLFYVWGGWKLFLISLAICMITWLSHVIICRKHSRTFLIIAIILVTSPLLIVKFCRTGIYPVGISFYTFEAISFIVDAYKKEQIRPESPLNVYLYMMFLATVTSGPITRYEIFKDGMGRVSSEEDFLNGLRRFAMGLGKKMLIADKIAPLADLYFDGISAGYTYSSLGLWIGSLAYTLQIYFDFSGYSDMAIGIAGMAGIKIPENFDYPYISKSVREFWKRWHISLSNWFRDYVYIPLGGNRCPKWKVIFNTLVVWLITGIWHGTNLTFIIWGLGYFALILLERYTKIGKALTDSKFLGHIYTIFWVNFLWIFFRADNFDTAINYIKGMFNPSGGALTENILIGYIPVMVIAILLCLPYRKLKDFIKQKPVFTAITDLSLIIVTVLSICAIANSVYTPYIYGKF